MGPSRPLELGPPSTVWFAACPPGRVLTASRKPVVAVKAQTVREAGPIWGPFSSPGHPVSGALRGPHASLTRRARNPPLPQEEVESTDSEKRGFLRK